LCRKIADSARRVKKISGQALPDCCPNPWSGKLFKCCSAAVGRGEEVRGWRREEKCQMTNEKCQMSNFKIQMADDGTRTTSTKLTDTDTKHTDNGHGTRTRESMSKFKIGNPWKTEKTNSERKGIWAIDCEAPERRGNGVVENLQSSIGVHQQFLLYPE
jgi:hypothetical protein